MICGICNSVQDNCSAYIICLLDRRVEEMAMVCSLTVRTLPTMESNAVLQWFELSLVASTSSTVCCHIKATIQVLISDTVIHFDWHLCQKTQSCRQEEFAENACRDYNLCTYDFFLVNVSPEFFCKQQRCFMFGLHFKRLRCMVWKCRWRRYAVSVVITVVDMLHQILFPEYLLFFSNESSDLW